jgi:hypothetical protein
LGSCSRSTVPEEAPSPLKPLGEPNSTKYSGETAIQEIPAIVTNLSGAEGGWVRVVASIVFDRKALQNPQATAAEIGEDIHADSDAGTN